MDKYISMVGQKFGSLLIRNCKREVISNRNRYIGEFECDCGNIGFARLDSISNGNKTHCGCQRDYSANSKTHGMYNSPEHQSWTAMKKRCLDVNNKSYHQYGANGVTICDRWLDKKNGFQNFYDDMGPRPEGTSLDRISPWGDYEPSNCRWADAPTQGINKKNTHGLTNTPTYQSWMHMRRSHEYPKEWDDIRVFVFDMGERPNGHELSRKDTSLPHSTENSYWAEGSALIKDKTGERNGMIVIIGRESNSPFKYIVRCDCGVEKSIHPANFNKTKSCGCLRRRQ